MTKILPITYLIKIINWKKFLTTILDKVEKTFFFFPNNNKKVQIALLLTNKILVIVLPEYFDFTNVFSFEFVAEFLKHISINNYTINFVES